MSSLKCIQSLSCFYVYFLLDGNHLDLHVLTHSVPTRRTSDLAGSAASTSGTAGSGPSLLTSPPRRQSRCHARAGTAPASASPRPSRRRSGGYARGDAASPRRGAGRRRGDRKGAVQGKSVSVRVDIGGISSIHTKNTTSTTRGEYEAVKYS